MPSLSWGLAWVTGRLIEAIVPTSLTFAIDALGPLGWFGITYALFESSGWRWSIWRRCGVVETPNFSGRWSGTLKSSFISGGERGLGGAVDCRFVIVQTFSHVRVRAEFASSRSWSTMAGIVVAPDERLELHYGYFNEAQADAARTMQSHAGYCRLWLIEGERALRGDYFTNARQDRPNFGTIDATRESAGSGL
jgi:hypothetical protein